MGKYFVHALRDAIQYHRSQKDGYMGLFNMFIVIPQIVAAVGGINFAYKTFFGDAIINTMLLAGACLIISGLCNFLITDPKAIKYQGATSS